MGRYLILSEAGDGVGLALRLKREGHAVRVWPRSQQAEKHGRGLVEFAEGYEFGEMLVADSTGFGLLLDRARDEGAAVFGGGTFADRLEADRKFSEEVMKSSGIAVPRSKSVTTWDEARAAAEKLSGGGRVALKPEGGLSGNLASYVASDPDDAAEMIAQWERTHMQGAIEMTVQEFVEGVAVSTEGWFNGEEWIEGMFNHTLEKKHFLAGDLGASGGCSGNVVWRCDRRDPIVEGTLAGMTELLRERCYCGPIDINCVVNERGVYGLEFTPRFGYDALPTLLHLAEFDFGDFVGSCARGQSSDAALADGYAAGVKLSISPYPSKRYDAQEGVPLRGFGPGDDEWFYPYNVRLEDEELRSSGGQGILGVMSGRGDVIGEAYARAYEICSRLKIPEVQYRVDLTEAILKDFRELNRIISGAEELPGWYGFDLDGTLAKHRKGQMKIGDPIEEAIKRMRRRLNAGKEVRIVTARGAIEGLERHAQLVAVYDWLRENVGTVVEVTASKDPQMIELEDDRVVEIEKNTGRAA